MNTSNGDWTEVVTWISAQEFDAESRGGRVYEEADLDWEYMLNNQILLIDELQQLLFGYFGLENEFDDLNEEIGVCVSDNLYPVQRVTAYLSIKALSSELLNMLQVLLTRFSGFAICMGLDHENEAEDFVAHLLITPADIRGTK